MQWAAPFAVAIGCFCRNMHRRFCALLAVSTSLVFSVAVPGGVGKRRVSSERSDLPQFLLSPPDDQLTVIGRSQSEFVAKLLLGTDGGQS